MGESRITKFIISLIFIAAIGWYGVRLATSQATTPFENFLITIILTAFAWLLSFWVSKADAEATANRAAASKIDAIARQSSQKLSDQSTNIFELEQFVEEILLVKESQENVDETDLYGLIQMLRTLRRTNTGLMEDWNGVASTEISKGISEQAKKQAELFKHIARPNSTDESDARNEEIESISRELPASVVPSRPYKSSSRIVGPVTQSVHDGATETVAEGFLIIETLQPTFAFTASGKLDPVFDEPPKAVWAELVETPPDCPTNVRVAAGAGTVYDFSVHLKSDDFGVHLPRGQYKIRYKAN